MASPLERARRTLLGAHDLRIDTEQLQPTCVAVASNGAFALVGCTDGSVRLAALGSARQAHKLSFLGQLVSRGLNNSLLVTISIADDCRHAFAGAQKGATEALAWDFSAAPVAGGAQEIVDATRQESRSDSKLRGFVACARAAPCDYRLLCGRGIKNAHVWRVHRPGLDAREPLEWALLYDLPTNAAGSLNFGGFLDGGRSVWAKSEGGVVRLWRADGTPDPPACSAPSEDLKQSKEAFAVVPADDGSASDATATPGTYVVVGGAYSLKVRDLAGVPRPELSLPPRPSAAFSRRSAPRTITSMAPATSGCAVAFADGAVAWYDAAAGTLLELDAALGAPPAVSCCALPLGGALVAVARWNVKEREGGVLLRVAPGGGAARAPTAADDAAAALWPRAALVAPEPRAKSPRGARPAPAPAKKPPVSSKKPPVAATKTPASKGPKPPTAGKRKLSAARVVDAAETPGAPSHAPAVTTQRRRLDTPGAADKPKRDSTVRFDLPDAPPSSDDDEADAPLEPFVPRTCVPTTYDGPEPGHALRVLSGVAFSLPPLRLREKPATAADHAAEQRRRLAALPPHAEIDELTEGRLKMEDDVRRLMAAALAAE